MTEETVQPEGSCVLCFRRDPKPGEGDICWWCRQWPRTALDELVDLWTHHLPDEVLTSTGRLNLHALDLMLPVPSIHSHRLRDGVSDGLVPHIVTQRRVVTVDVEGGSRQVVTWERHLVRAADGSPELVPANDQTGEIPTLRWLDQWARYWQEARADMLPERLPVPTPDRLAGWLRARVDWAADHDEAFGDFCEELREHLALMRRVTGMSAKALPVPCPKCDLLTLKRFPLSAWEECSFCHALVGPRRVPGRREPRPGEFDERVEAELAAMEAEQAGGAA
jgi:hypothetical protein